ncbi:hypothetical protein KFE96_15410 [Kordiimonas sp. SCSIO 12603]|uniref:PAS domain-containing protein n=1 Tax=Kordiimonas sp. SCSIO 12603 TaxID=2829596 RepID=UPI0021077887|nr:PAS domain-containing protein [Kordiimonas sp. SCSIO 12603]UTW58194.1 hypothetical protein KFE96_15410 [Kordiimonas sp. SCSIO 12603]
MKSGERIAMELQIGLPAFAESTELRHILSTWRKWAGNELLPLRKNVNLRDISQYLDCLLLLDVISYEEVRIRYFPSLYMDFLGADYTGQNYLDVTEAKLRELRAKRFMNIANKPCAAVWTTQDVQLWTNRKQNTFQDYAIGISLPIMASEDGSKPMQVMTICVTPAMGQRPAFFEQPKHTVALANLHEYVDIGAGVPQPD